MHGADGFALAAQATGDVHQAASVARHQGISPGALEAGDLCRSMASEISGYFTAKLPQSHSTVLPNPWGPAQSPQPR